MCCVYAKMLIRKGLIIDEPGIHDSLSSSTKATLPQSQQAGAENKAHMHAEPPQSTQPDGHWQQQAHVPRQSQGGFAETDETGSTGNAAGEAERNGGGENTRPETEDPGVGGPTENAEATSKGSIEGEL